MTTYVIAIGVITVVLFVSLIAWLLFMNLTENYVCPPNKWTVKVFLLLLFLLSIPVICIAWIVSKLFAVHD